MRKITLCLFAITLLFGANAQTADNRFSIPLNLTLNHYDGDLGNEIFKLGESSLGFETGLKYYLSPSFNVGATFNFFKLDFAAFETNATDLDLAFEYKLYNNIILSEDAKLKPFLTAGIGVLHSNDFGGNKNFGAIPLGAGVRYGISESVDAMLQSRYKITPYKNTFDYLTTSIGIVITPKSKKDSDGDGVLDRNDKCPSLAGSLATGGCPDSDGDGIADREDNCPKIAGIAQFMGCPDTDGDGITDLQDSCPNDAGTKENNGCPDTDGDGILDKDDDCPQVAGIAKNSGCPDSDGDGVADKDDQCPEVAGLTSNGGCPEKDTDNDGVIDKNDNCPTIAGTTANKGCPEVNEDVKEILREALEGVQFKSGSDVLLASSYGKLDKVVKVLNDYPSYKLQISGYTDNTGSADANLKLSDRRANTTKKYLTSKGIAESRISAKGYGIVSPIADNNTREGRAKNRRVEFKIIFK